MKNKSEYYNPTHYYRCERCDFSTFILDEARQHRDSVAHNLLAEPLQYTALPELRG
jgi:hypothetical protein